MRIAILTQVYYPDTVSVSQHLSDLAERLCDEGHQVRVITSRYGYDTQDEYSKYEIKESVEIFRVNQTNFNKSSFILRAVNFLTFNLSL